MRKKFQYDAPGWFSPLRNTTLPSTAACWNSCLRLLFPFNALVCYKFETYCSIHVKICQDNMYILFHSLQTHLTILCIFTLFIQYSYSFIDIFTYLWYIFPTDRLILWIDCGSRYRIQICKADMISVRSPELQPGNRSYSPREFGESMYERKSSKGKAIWQNPS